jgi:hypothetical protein
MMMMCGCQLPLMERPSHVPGSRLAFYNENPSSKYHLIMTIECCRWVNNTLLVDDGAVRALLSLALKRCRLSKRGAGALLPLSRAFGRLLSAARTPPALPRVAA